LDIVLTDVEHIVAGVGRLPPIGCSDHNVIEFSLVLPWSSFRDHCADYDLLCNLCIYRGATTFSKLGVQFIGLGYCTEQNTDGIPSFVHCSLLRNGNHTIHQKSWGGPFKFFWGSGLSRPPSGCALVYLLLTGIILWIPFGSPIAECIYWEAVDSTCLYHKLEMVIAPKPRCSCAVRKCAVTKRRLWKHLKKWPVDTYLRNTYCDCV